MWHGVHITSVHGRIYVYTPLCNDSTCVRVTFMRELEILARLMSRSPGGCQEHRSKLTTAATRVFWDKHKCTGMQTQNSNINTQTPGAHVYYSQICLFVWVACVSENTSPAIAPPAFRAQSPPIWWVFVPEIRIHNHLDLSHFVSLEIRLSYLTHSRRRSRLGRKEFLNTFLSQAFETKTFWMKTVCSSTIPRVLLPPLYPGRFCCPK